MISKVIRVLTYLNLHSSFPYMIYICTSIIQLFACTGFEKFNKLINSLGYLKLLVEALRFLYKKKLITAPTFLLPLFEDDEKKEGGEKGDEGSGKSPNEAQNITCENLYWNWTTTIHCVNLHKAEEKEPVDDENAHGTTDNESK